MSIAARLAVAFIAALLCVGCADDTTGVRIGNQPPRVRITQGPMSDSLHIHRVTFHWTGEDSDGHIAGYEYAVDDTTLAESRQATADRSVSLVFTADDFYDTIVEIHQGLPVELARFGKHHTFHVRGQDDGGLWSPHATAAFYAITVAPASQITNPIPTAVPRVGTSFSVSWNGEDLDGSQPPEMFATRLVKIPDDSLFTIGIDRLDCDGCGPPWTAFSSEATARFESMQLGAYLFGVRAMDEAGAVEPELRLGGNAMRLRVSEHPGAPRVTFSGPGKVIALPSGDEEEKTFDLISGRPANLGWSADASHYSAHIVSIDYGIDLDSIDPDASGWIPTPNPGVSVTFDNPSGVEEVLHGFYLLVRDSIGQERVVDVMLRVGPPDLELDILYVDDIGGDEIGSPSRPSDEDGDRFIMDLVLAEGQRRGLRIDQYEVQDPGGGLEADAPDLAVLRRYKLVVWSVASTNSVLHQSMDPGGGLPLGEYLTLGGNLWLMGNRVLSRTKFDIVTEYFGFTPQDFGYQFLHVESEYDGGQIVAGEFLRPSGNSSAQRVDGMDGAATTPRAAAEGWPELLVARPPYDDRLRGMPSVEGMTKGYVHGDRPGQLDTLYTYITNGSRWRPFPIPSRMDSTPCAFRFEGLDHGKTMVFTFPMFWWSDGAADSLGSRAIEWFLDED